MIGEECVLEFFQGLQSRGQGLDSQGQDQDQGLQNCPRGRGLVLEDSVVFLQRDPGESTHFTVILNLCEQEPKFLLSCVILAPL